MNRTNLTYENAIAIVGMAGRFPGADDVPAFWKNLLEGKESLATFADDPLAGADNYVPARGTLSDIEEFDAALFGMTPREAELTDPQHRVLLEVAWQTLEDAGYDPEQFSGAIGVYAGMSRNTYFLQNLYPHRHELPVIDAFPAEMGNEKDYLATRISYKLGLTGPSVAVSTACSTSLVAVYHACESLLNHQCDLALAGGVSVRVPQQRGYWYEEGSIASPDGHCRAYDADGSGTVFSNGAGLVLLKRLEEAVHDGDRISAVIRGIALNNDGATKVSFAAPSVGGQAEVIALAHALADVDPASIGYVEGHGTATPLGDPIEVAALTQAFRAGTDRRQYCALGSVKSNIGHTDAAAGVLGLIKAALVVREGQIPPSLHIQQANPKFEIEQTPFYLADRLQPWPLENLPRRAGVSSFGTGGTNAHAVLEQPPEPVSSGPGRDCQLLMLSAADGESLVRQSEKLARHLRETDEPLADVAYTLHVGRKHLPYRRFVVGRSNEEAASALTSSASRTAVEECEFKDRPVVFMFPGQGAQHVGMGRELYDSEPVFRDEVDRCADLLQPLLAEDLRELVYPRNVSSDEATERLKDTAIAQPAIFTISYALARLWQSWGISPHAMIGHSVGEFVAACVAGVFSLEDALRVLAVRGRLMQGLPAGEMLAVALDECALLPLLDAELSIAAVNGPNSCVVSGPSAAIERFRNTIAAQEIGHRPLQTSHAFHSAMLDPILDTFADEVRGVELKEPNIPLVASPTGQWLTDRQAADPAYWSRHMRDTVRFADGRQLLAQEPSWVLLEVGPGSTLASLAKQPACGAEEQVVVSSMGHARHGGASDRALLMALGQLWTAGVRVDAEAFYGSQRRCRVPLPTYSFARKRFWIDPPAPDAAAAAESLTAQRGGATIAAADTKPEDTATTADNPQQPVTRRQQIFERVAAILYDLGGVSPDALDEQATFLELGFDSLFLTQVSVAIRREFKADVTFRQLMDETTTTDLLVEYLHEALPSPAPAEPAPAKPAAGQTEQAHAEHQAEHQRFGPWKSPLKRSATTLTAAQQHHIDELVREYTARTAKSKELTDRGRSVHADPRAAAGFHPAWKEMVYPIVASRSLGARLWDADGNEYVDLQSGFGSSLFGHSPDFVRQAVSRQLELGVHIGPQLELAGKVAEGISQLTSMERVTFCNTGSEAVMAAMRVARCVSGRDLVATFKEDYHGQFDEVLLRGVERDGQTRSVPIAPGIPRQSVKNMLVLELGDPRSLDVIEQFADKLAAVLVEPVQSRHPQKQPREFLQRLRRWTAEHGVCLIFDEVITGFRLAPGGAQQWYGVEADLAAYGKVIGGGMPIGVLAGKAKYLNSLDGGPWQFGDNSVPQADVTYFAGTFVRHPLVIAAADAVLEHLQSHPSLQAELNERSTLFARSLNEMFGSEDVGLKVESCGSMLYLRFAQESEFNSLLYYHLRQRGVYLLEGRAFFLTTAHSDDDLALVVDAFRESVAALKQCGFLACADTPRIHIPLTESQSEVWLASQMGANTSCAYNEIATTHLHGTLDIGHLRRALQEVAARHEALSACFSPDGSRQTIVAGEPLEVPLIDHSLLAEGQREQKVAEVLAGEASTAFDLEKGPLLRTKLIRLSHDHHVLVFVVHHLVCDGWSMGVLHTEIAQAYSAFIEDRQLQLPAAPRFSEHAQQRWEQRESEAVARSYEYWTRRFQDIPPVLDLPTDRPRPRVRSNRGGTATRQLDPLVIASIRQTAADLDATLFATLYAAFGILLARLSGSHDLVVALNTAGQATTGEVGLVGHCVNLLPLRFAIDRDGSFADHLSTLRQALMDAHDHQHCTLGGILRKLNLPRDPGRAPLVEVDFNLDQNDGGDDFAGLRAARAPGLKRAVHFDMFWNVSRTGDALRVDCHYNTDLFDNATILRWIGCYETLLAAIAKEPLRAVASLPLLTNAEQTRILGECSSKRVFPHDRCLHQLFEARAAQTPDAIAVEFGEEQLTYDELNRRSNQLAHYLIRQGVGPEVLVGLHLNRSWQVIVGILGIIKAGGGYVPLDPAYPRERVQFILDDCQAAVLVTQEELREGLANNQASVVCLDSDWTEIARESSDNPVCEVSPDNLAYVIYTSGSTGQPKGCLVTHANVSRLFSATAEWFDFSSQDVWTLFHSPAFDFSVWEIWGALLYGGRLVIVPYWVSRAPDEFLKLLADRGVTILNQTPSAFYQLMEAEQNQQVELPSLRQVIFGGEALDLAKLKPWIDRHGDERPQLINMYGITETTVHVTYRRITKSDVAAGRGSLIGVPIPDLHVYLLNEFLDFVPDGVVAEIFVGGAGVARGYLNRTELTSSRFVENPFQPGTRLYRSGDLARRLPDGDLEYLGRADSQVKLRGFRIELGEIEAVIRRHPGVRELTVDMQSQAGDQPVLAAYIIPANGVLPSWKELREFARRSLPEYMVPTAFVQLDSLPLTAHGKVDRQALAALETSRPEAGADYTAPCDKIERQLATIWSDVLGIERIGTRENFFDLGGHSLLAARLFSLIEKELGRKLPLATLFQAQTIAELADFLRHDDREGSWRSLVPIQPEGNDPPFFFVHAHGGNVVGYRELAGHLGRQQPFYGLQARGLGDSRQCVDNIKEMAANYLTEIRSVQPHGPYRLGGWCMGGVIAFEMAQQLRSQGEEVALLVLVQATLANYPQYKPGTTRLGKTYFRILQRLDQEWSNMLLAVGPKARLAFLSGRIAQLYRLLNNKLRRGLSGLGVKRSGRRAGALGLEQTHELAYANYEPCVYDGTVLIFRSARQPLGIMEEPELGWKSYLAHAPEIVEVPGHAIGMLDEPRVQLVSDLLRRRLAATSGELGRNKATEPRPAPSG